MSAIIFPRPMVDWNRFCSVHHTSPVSTALKSASRGLLSSSSATVWSSPSMVLL